MLYEIKQKKNYNMIFQTFLIFLLISHEISGGDDDLLSCHDLSNFFNQMILKKKQVKYIFNVRNI